LVEGGSAEVKVEFGGQEFEFVVQETDETAIASAIASNQDLVDAGFTLSASDIMGMWDFEVEEEEEKLKIRAKTLGTNTEVKVKREFSLETTEINSVISQIVQKFPVDEITADNLLKIEPADVGGELEEKFKVKAKEKDGSTEVKVEIRFILDSVDRIDIINAIVDMTQVTSEQIEDALQEEEEVETEEEETAIEVEVEGGSAEVKVEFGGQEFEFVNLWYKRQTRLQ